MRSVLAIVVALLSLGTTAAAAVSQSEMPFVNAHVSASGDWDFDFTGWPNVSFIDGFMGYYVWQDGESHSLCGAVTGLDLTEDYSLLEIGFGWLNNSGGYLVFDKDELGYFAYLEYEAEVPASWEMRLDSSGNYDYEVIANPDGSFTGRVKDSTGWQTVYGPVSHTLPTVDRVFAVALTDGGTASATVSVEGAIYTIRDATDSSGAAQGLLEMQKVSDTPSGGATLSSVQDISGDPGAAYLASFNAVGVPGLKEIGVGYNRASPGGLPTGDVESYDTYALTLRNDEPTKFVKANLFVKTGYTEAPYDMTEVLTQGPAVWIAPGKTATLSVDLRTIGLTDDSNTSNGNYGASDRRRWLSAIGFNFGTNVVASGASDAYCINQGESLAVSVVPAQNSLSLLVAGDSRFVKPNESAKVYLAQSGLTTPVVGHQSFLTFDALLGIDPGAVTLTAVPYPVGLYNHISGNEIDLAAGIDNPALQPPVTDDGLLANMIFTAGPADGVAQVGFLNREPPTQFSDDQGDTVAATTACSPFITIDGIPPVVTVLSPNGGEFLKGGGTCNVRWVATDANIDPYSITIEYYLGSPPESPWHAAAWNQVNSGVFAWFPIPTINYSGTLVRVTAIDRAGNVTSDVSDAPFIIDSTRPKVDNISARQSGGPDITPSGTAIQGAVDIAVATSDNLSGVAGPPVVEVTPLGGTAETAVYVNESPTGTYNYTWTVGPTTPNGTATIAVTGLCDRSGNVALTALDTFIVNKTQAVVNLELERVSVPLVTRWIKFVIGGTGGAVSPVTVRQQVTFANGIGSTTLTNIPVTSAWTRVSAKDEQHTLRRTVALTDVGSQQYTASFTGASSLTGGDLTNDGAVSIVDFGVFTTQYGTSPALDTQWPVRNANVCCDGTIDTNDFSYIQIHFLATSDPEVGGSLPASGPPLSSVSVLELAEVIGLGAAQAADLDGDGTVDAKDVGLFARELITVKGGR